jgi:hypothetical protein
MIYLKQKIGLFENRKWQTQGNLGAQSRATVAQATVRQIAEVSS